MRCGICSHTPYTTKDHMSNSQLAKKLRDLRLYCYHTWRTAPVHALQTGLRVGFSKSYKLLWRGRLAFFITNLSFYQCALSFLRISTARLNIGHVVLNRSRA